MKTLAQLLAETREANPPAAIPMHGYTWGRWTVVERGPPMWRGQNSRATWIVRCECGVERTETGTQLRSDTGRARVTCWRCDG